MKLTQCGLSPYTRGLESAPCHAHSNPLPQHDVGRQTRQRQVPHGSWLLGVADPHAVGVEINSGIMLHQWEVVIAVARRDPKLMSDGHLPQSEDPRSGMCRCHRSVLLPNCWTRGKSTSRAHSTTSSTGEPWRASGDQPSSRGIDWPQTMAGRPSSPMVRRLL
jgi:hypothetical protein